MKKKLTACFMCILMMCLLLPDTIHADTGPKPSIRITFENMGDEECYGTLLSQNATSGPAFVWDGNPNNIINNDTTMDIWQAFVDYEDADGYYYLQETWLCSEDKKLNWTYYPPYSFKILLYYPETDTFTVSGIYERYAFDSYYTVTMEGHEIASVDIDTYDYTGEITSFVCRVVITIVLELAIALLFGLRRKKQILIILGVNVVTQIGLNAALNAINYNSGFYAFVLGYILLELLVFVVEAAAYLLLLRKFTDPKVAVWKIIVYALTANIVSFVGGMAIALIIPSLF